MNILTAVVLVFLVIFAIRGYRKGLVEEIIQFTTTLIGVIVLYILLKGLGNFLQGNVLNVIMALIILFVIRLLHKIIKIILDSCKLVAKIPVMYQVDKITGVTLGILQGIIMIWLFFAIGGYYHFWTVEEWITDQIAESRILSILYHSNYLVYLLMKM